MAFLFCFIYCLHASVNVLIACLQTLQIFLKVAEDSGVDAVELSGEIHDAF